MTAALVHSRTLTSGRPENADNLERASAASEQALLLAELDDDGLSVGALHALECALILAQTLGWLDLRQKHRQPAFRASSLTDRRLGRVEVLGLSHCAKPLDRLPVQSSVSDVPQVSNHYLVYSEAPALRMVRCEINGCRSMSVC